MIGYQLYLVLVQLLISQSCIEANLIIKCKFHEDCGVCGYCANRPKSINGFTDRECIFPYLGIQFDTEKKTCYPNTVCKINNTCKPGGKCHDGFGYYYPTCECIHKYFGNKCQKHITRTYSYPLSTGITVIPAVDFTRTEPKIFTINVYVATLKIGKGVSIIAHTSEGYFTKIVNSLQGGCSSHTSRKFFPYKPYFADQERCFQQRFCTLSLADIPCRDVYYGDVIFPFKRPSSPGVLTLDGRPIGYRAYINVTLWNDEIEVFSQTYPTFVYYKFSLAEMHRLPYITLKNCAESITDEINKYFRRMGFVIESDLGSSESGIKVVWELFKIRASEPDQSKNTGLEWSFKPFTLKADQYKVVLTASNLVETGRMYNFGVCYFKVESEPLIANIEGGTVRRIHQGDGLFMSGLKSYNPNEEKRSQAELMFLWKCEPHCNDLVEKEAKYFYIKPHYLMINKTYNFTLKVSSKGLQSGFSFQEVHVVYFGISIHCIMNCFPKVNPTDPTLFEALSVNKESALNYVTWMYKTEDELEYAGVDKISTNEKPGSVFLGVKPNTLNESTIYCFNASAMFQLKQLSTHICVTTDSRPQNGSCAVSPTRGVAGVTLFNITCIGYRALDGDILFYEVYNLDTSQETEEYEGVLLDTNTEEISSN